jgi:hypothetical protein
MPVATRRKKKSEPSELSRDICRQVVLRDAKNWWKRDYPRVYTRPKTIKHNDPAVRHQIDKFFATMNREIDDATMVTYDKLYDRYGGDLNDLPWNKSGRLR